MQTYLESLYPHRVIELIRLKFTTIYTMPPLKLGNPAEFRFTSIHRFRSRTLLLMVLVIDTPTLT